MFKHFRQYRADCNSSEVITTHSFGSTILNFWYRYNITAFETTRDIVTRNAYRVNVYRPMFWNNTFWKQYLSYSQFWIVTSILVTVTSYFFVFFSVSCKYFYQSLTVTKVPRYNFILVYWYKNPSLIKML